MSIATLKRTPAQKPAASMRSTDGQDRQIEQPRGWRHDRRLRIGALAALGLLGVIALVVLLKGWATTEATVSIERVRLGTVTRGEFLSDVAAQATVVAAVSPTLYAPAAGTVTLSRNAGDVVKKGDLLGTIDSPGLRNEFAREKATLESLVVDLRRQDIDVRRKILQSQQTADMAGVSIRAAEREFARAQTAWEQKVISQRDYQRAQFVDGYSRFAKLPKPRQAHVSWHRFLDSLQAVAPFTTDGIVPGETGWFDESQLEQVMINLLKNAAEAGSPPQLTVVTVHAARGGWSVEVRDRGSGMSPDVLQNSLLPFYSTKPAGSGLGLTLCREIVEAHGGTFEAGNRTDGEEGAVIRFWLPPAPATAPYGLRGSAEPASIQTP